jgi:hypothetical protein
MQGRKFEPGESGWGDPAPQNREATPKNEERRQAFTPATLEENVEKPVDDGDGTRNRLQEQSYPERWLRAHYSVSGALAAIIAGEFGWGET